MNTRRIAFINEKGGTCKTTFAINVGAYLATERGARVLLVDMDPQGHVGKGLGIEDRHRFPTVDEVLSNPEAGVLEALRRTRVKNLDLIASDKSLATFGFGARFASEMHLRLRRALAGVEGYDYILLDAPPSLGPLTLNVMLATEEIVIPVSLTYFAMDGCAEILDTVEVVRRVFMHSHLRVALVVPTLYRRTRLADEILERLRQHFPDRLARTVIGYSVKIDEAQSHGRTIWEYAPGSRGAEWLASLAEEVAESGSERTEDGMIGTEGPGALSGPLPGCR